MYGLVNKAIQDLVTEKFGEDKWVEIKKRSGFEDDFFIGLQPYPDKLTYSLVQHAAEVLGHEASVVMEAFGEYWILYTADEGYGELMELSGDTLTEFLNNLNMLHQRINNIMPGLRPPDFSTRAETANSIELEYRSHREGLSPMVIGLLKGLCRKFGKENYTVYQVEKKSDDSNCDVFRIEWQ